MKNSRFRPLFLALSLLVIPGALAAQQPAQTQSPNQEEVQGWLTELQQLHGRLEALQAKALSDPAISAQQEALGTSIKTAMEKIDPSLQKSLSRMEELEAQAADAEKSGDNTKLQQLGAEARQIEQQFVSARAQALQQPELVAQMLEFQEKLEKKMLEADPDAPKLIARFQELEEKLTTAAQSAGR